MNASIPHSAPANWEGARLVNDSLSIVVPVRNVEATLANQIARLLDVLPDLTGSFEIVLVDDASTDHTIELARELAAQFPQLRLVRHREVRGIEAAVRTGLQWVTGRTVFVQEDPAALSIADLRQLWALRHNEEVVMARAEGRPNAFDQRLLDRLARWGRALQREAARARGIHMIRRDAALDLLADDAPDTDPTIAHVASEQQSRADQSHGGPRPQRAATFLRHLQNLALGE
jgi:glycosyltransferase involved in cell wall biosynthesis